MSRTRIATLGHKYLRCISPNSRSVYDLVRGFAVAVQPSGDEKLTTPVAIVGGGPSGLTLSILLSQFGIKNTLIERRAKTVEHPQAHFINMRTMEIFREMGDIEQKIKALSPPLKEWRKFIYCEKMLGHTFGETDHFKTYMEDFSEFSPTDVAHLSQNKLLPLLFEKAKQSSSIRLLEEEHALSMKKEKDHVVVESITNTGNTREISARYVVCADGANSKMREFLNINMEGLGGRQSIMNIHFHSDILAKSLQGREAMLYFVFNPKVICVIVAHNISDGEFVAQVPFFPPVEEDSKFTHEYCMNLLHDAIGEDMALQIEHIRPWNMSAQVANTYQDGNVFLVGDSAHVFPPAGGFGMNTGIQDAHNLAWKLAYVLKGQADETLLQSYTSERRNIGMENTALSMANLKQTLDVSRVFGLDPTIANGLVSAFSTVQTSSALDVPLKGVAQFVLDLGKLQTSSWNPLRFVQSRHLRKMFEEGKTLRLLYPSEDIGFCYEEKDRTLQQCMNERMKVSQSTRYKPILKVGARLPHVTFLVPEKNAHRLASSLDIVFSHAPKFVLFTKASEQGAIWNTAAKAVSAENIPVVSVCIKLESRKDAASVEGNTIIDQAGVWHSQMQVEEDSMVLVRPDGHIAAIEKFGSSKDAYTILMSIFNGIGLL